MARTEWSYIAHIAGAPYRIGQGGDRGPILAEQQSVRDSLKRRRESWGELPIFVLTPGRAKPGAISNARPVAHS
jgi:hypothetical protein